MTPVELFYFIVYLITLQFTIQIHKNLNEPQIRVN